MSPGRMTMIAMTFAAAFALGRAGITTAGPAGAQEPPAPATQPAIELEALAALARAAAPGPRHDVLDRITGTWTAEFTMRLSPEAEPLTFTAEVRRRWVLGGRFVEERFEAETAMGPLRGIGYIGFNTVDQQYEAIWMDTQSTAIGWQKGTLHGDRMLLHMRTERRDPITGRVVYSWSKLDMTDPDRHTMSTNTTSADGTTYRLMDATMVRAN